MSLLEAALSKLAPVEEEKVETKIVTKNDQHPPPLRFNITDKKVAITLNSNYRNSTNFEMQTSLFYQLFRRDQCQLQQLHQERLS